MEEEQTAVASELRGFTRLAIDATAGMVNLIEDVQQTVERPFGFLIPPLRRPLRGLTALAYGVVRGITHVVGATIEAILIEFAPLLGTDSTWPGRGDLLAALNGVVGDYLSASGNPLAISMSLRHGDQRLSLDRQAIAAMIPQATGKVVVLAHALCMSELRWTRDPQNYGNLLARDLGYTPVFLRYNSGCHISTNGRQFADLLEALVKRWPVPIEELSIIGYSMGGLVTRSACHYAGLQGFEWLHHLRRIIFVGTPHFGAPLERGGNWVDILLGSNPFTAPFARIGKIRSAGITDLRHGNLLDEDWQGRDRFERAPRQPAAPALPRGVLCYAIAATTGQQEGDLSDRILGDGLVKLDSALGRHEDPTRSLAIPDSRQWIVCGRNHMDLIKQPEVYDKIRQWLAESA